MSWLTGIENTSIGSDLSSLWQNATTGTLSDSQKTDIATATTNEYLPCATNPGTPDCVALLSQEESDVNAAEPDTNCVFQIPWLGLPCFQSWGSVAFVVFGFFAVLWLMKAAIMSLPGYIAAGGKG